MVMKFLDFLQRHLPPFSRDGRGNVVITFALATIPIFGAVAAAVDYSRANSTRTALQGAVDSTALMLSREAVGLDTAQLKTRATQLVLSLVNRPEAKSIDVTPKFTSANVGQFSLTVSATGKIDTTIARVIGLSAIDIDVSSQVHWGMKKLELALALDNTGSMSSSNKMTELKTAAKNLLETLKKAEKKKDDIRVAIIPFDTTVKIGTQTKNLPWFDWNYLIAQLGYSVSYSQLTGQYQQALKDFWQGCVTDREQQFDVQDAPPSPVDPLSLFPPVQCDKLAQLLPLSSDWTTLNAKIDEMQPNGNTNVTIGLVWAWHALTKEAPLNEAKQPSSDLEKVIIVLTDGTNTQNRFTTVPSLIDARTKKACDNIKASNIKLYTVRVIEGNADLLKGCATSPDMFYDVQDATQLNAVFKSIAAKLANLYIAQ
jgi:Flp pilus assembly protein TadG